MLVIAVIPTVVCAQRAKSALSICGRNIEIGSTRATVDAAFADSSTSCKLMRLDNGTYAVESGNNAKDRDLNDYIRFDGSRVTEIEREINVEGDAEAGSFTFFYLLQDFERSLNVSCKISSFENREDWLLAHGTVLDCGNRALKMVKMEFKDGKQTVDVSEVLRK